MKKQLKLLFFVAMLVTLVVVTMVMACAAVENYQYVNEDGSDGYAETLAEAIAAAKDGTTIKVLQAIPEADNEITMTGKTLTLDGGNHKIVVPAAKTDTYGWIRVDVGAKLTMINMNVEFYGTSEKDADGGEIRQYFLQARGGESAEQSAELNILGKNTFVISLNGSTSDAMVTTASTGYGFIAINYGTLNIKGTDAENQITISMIGHGRGGIGCGANSTINVDWVKMTTPVKEIEGVGTDADGNPLYTSRYYVTAQIYVTAGTAVANVSNSTLDNEIWEFAAEKTGAFYLKKGKLNITNCVATGYHAIFVADNGTLNVDGGTYTGVGLGEGKTPPDYDVATNTTSTGESLAICVYDSTANSTEINIFDGTFHGCRGAFRLSGTTTLNIYGGTMENTHTSGKHAAAVILIRSASTVNIYGGTLAPKNYFAITMYTTGATVNVYGGTIDGGANNLLGVRGDNNKYNFVDAGTEYEDYAGLADFLAGKSTTKKSEGADITSKGGNMFVHYNNTAYSTTIYLGNGLRLQVNKGTVFGSLEGSTVTVGEVACFAASAGRFPVADKATNDWRKATFYIMAAATIATGTHNITSIDQLLALGAAASAIDDGWNIASPDDEMVEGKINVGKVMYRLDIGVDTTVNILSGDYLDLGEQFLVVRGGALNIMGGTFEARSDFASEDYVFAIGSAGGSINVSGNPTFKAAWEKVAFLFFITAGTLTIDCDTDYHKTKYAEVFADFENDYASANDIEDANFTMEKAGTFICVKGKATTVIIEDGSFLRKSAINPTDGKTFGGCVVHTTDTYKEAITTSITINDGVFYSNCISRIGTTVVDADGNSLQGVTLNLNGGIFVGNAVYETTYTTAYMFMHSAKGHHVYNVAENADLTLYASKYELRVFYGNSAAKGNSGVKYNILGGKYYFSCNFLYSTYTFTNVEFTLENATLVQREVAPGFYDSTETVPAPSPSAVFYLINQQKTGETVLTLKNVSVTATNGPIFETGDERVKINVISGLYVGDQVVGKSGDAETVPSITVTGGTFIQTGKHESVFFFEADVTDALVLAKEGVAYNGANKFDKYAPVILYAEEEYKFWTTTAAIMVGAPVIESGASVYLGPNGNSTSVEDCGIRFKSSFNLYELDESLEALGWSSLVDPESTGFTGIGHIIAPADYVAAVIARGGKFTHADLEALGEELGILAVIDIPASSDKLIYNEETGDVTFAAALYNLKSTTRAYAAVPYVLVQDAEGNDTYVYGAYDIVDNARSAEQIAYRYSVENPGYYANTAVLKQYYTANTEE